MGQIETNCWWEIYVPTILNGKPIRTRFHRVWDGKVRDIAGGLTILKPVYGQWVSQGNLFAERMIPCRIMCSEEQINAISDMTAEYYQQQAIFFSLLSEKAVIKHYERKETGS